MIISVSPILTGILAICILTSLSVPLPSIRPPGPKGENGTVGALGAKGDKVDTGLPLILGK